jgi:hypothetical protein
MLQLVDSISALYSEDLGSASIPIDVIHGYISLFSHNYSDTTYAGNKLRRITCFESGNTGDCIV